MNRFLQLVVISFVLLVVSNAVNAQEKIPESKRKLIAEMISVFKMDTQLAQMVDGILKSMESSYPIGFNASIDTREDLTKAQKDQLKADSAKYFQNFSQRFREQLPQYVDFDKYIQESVYPLYNKFYSEEELKAIIDFYRTPAGQKVISTLPELLIESNKAAEEKFLPQIIPLIQRLTKEDFDRIGSPARKPIK